MAIQVMLPLAVGLGIGLFVYWLFSDGTRQTPLQHGSRPDLGPRPNSRGSGQGNARKADGYSKANTRNNSSKSETRPRRPICESRCGICLEEMSVKILPCDHIFHKECIQRWENIKPVCPICRRDTS